MRARLSELVPSDIDNLNIRHHGDFHLGQMLIVKDDIFIIDFEGEPRRPHSERRRKGPAARDVAGLIRSIDYSATAALDRALKISPGEQGKLAGALAEWRDRATAAFLAAYREAMTNRQLWPADRRAAERMLNFFLIDKAFYEIEYELAHRPDWLRVPLTGMLRILSGHKRGFMTKLSAEAYAIIEGRHSDPFHYLGLHTEGDQMWCAPSCPKPPMSRRSASMAKPRRLSAFTMPACLPVRCRTVPGATSCAPGSETKWSISKIPTVFRLS